MQATRDFITKLGLPAADAHALPDSEKRFPDGAQYRIEIPSVEGPRVMEAVIKEAKRLDVQVHRVSQGSGIMMHTDDEIREMASLGAKEGIEVSLFVGPRAGWDIGAQILSPAGKNLGARLRGMDQVVYAIEDVKRACSLGIRGVLVADEGLLWIIDEMKKAGELPSNLVVKISVQMGAANPASIQLLEKMGANTYNTPTDLTLAQLAAIRQATSIPLDVYVEAPDNFGGFVRHYEVPELIRVAAPVYVKLGLRNAPDVYPSGSHIEGQVIGLGIERVRRARLVQDMINRYTPTAVRSKPSPEDLAIPDDQKNHKAVGFASVMKQGRK